MTGTPSLITPEPDITTTGSWVLVCYDFKSTGATSPVTLTFSPSGGGDEITETVSAEEPCVRYRVPHGCSGVNIVDESGQSSDAAIVVTP